MTHTPVVDATVPTPAELDALLSEIVQHHGGVIESGILHFHFWHRPCTWQIHTYVLTPVGVGQVDTTIPYDGDVTAEQQKALLGRGIESAVRKADESIKEMLADAAGGALAAMIRDALEGDDEDAPQADAMEA